MSSFIARLSGDRKLNDSGRREDLFSNKIHITSWFTVVAEKLTIAHLF
jgi:hypothetical protein